MGSQKIPSRNSDVWKKYMLMNRILLNYLGMRMSIVTKSNETYEEIEGTLVSLEPEPINHGVIVFNVGGEKRKINCQEIDRITLILYQA